MPRKKRSKTKKNNLFSKPYFLTICIVVLFALGYFCTSLILGTYSNNLAVENQKLVYDIQQRQANIEQLKGEIAQLQEKSRVLGMLEGQVYENPNNVFYYGSSSSDSTSTSLASSQTSFTSTQ